MRFVCIHGHFYQPPRENPWLEEIEVQDSAYPYHDWNERITHQSYAPNAFSRNKEPDGVVINIVNNYARTSFNFGPTLLSWMERHNKAVYDAIIEADEASREHFSGHGSAIAQVYNHMIMPLANQRDKETQVRWGIRDFEKRFNRKPEGIWLPETAVDTPTLEVLAKHGIHFTILSPPQANRIRKIGEKKWHDVSDGSIDPRRPYLCRLPSGNEITLFFYDGVTSQDIAFNDLLNNGQDFAQRLKAAFSEGGDAQLVHIATDGESYGHHHMFGDMALAYCLHAVDKDEDIHITNYGEFLANNQPHYVVEIKENTSWSCMHGVKRWWTDCGCNSGMKPGWHQQWREPMRNAMDWLRDHLEPIYEHEVSHYVEDPWKLRDEYIDVVLNREKLDEFLACHAKHELSKHEKEILAKLLEMQRYAMLMYTSCGWFFDEISGIESIQVLEYAVRAIQLAEEATGVQFLNHFLEMLEKAPSNVPEFGNGRVAVERLVLPEQVNLIDIGVHYAISSLFKKKHKKEESQFYCYRISDEVYDVSHAGKLSLLIGKAHIRSEVILEEITIQYAVLWLGDYNLTAGVMPFNGEDAFEAASKEIRAAFDEGDVQGTLSAIGKHFPEHIYSLKHLFTDDKKHIMDQVLENSLDDAIDHFNQVFEDNYNVIHFVREMGLSNHRPLTVSAEIAIGGHIQQLLESSEIELDRLSKYVQDAKKFSVPLDKDMLSLLAGRRVAEKLRGFSEDPTDMEKLNDITSLLEILTDMPISLNLWESQNIAFSIWQERPKAGTQDADTWLEKFHHLTDMLGMKLKE